MGSRWRVGLLTGGGDSSGINAFLRSICLGVWQRGGEAVGIRNGWAGLVEPSYRPLTPADVDGITMLPGTLLGTSRTNVVRLGLLEQVVRNIEEAGLTHLVVVGGDDTLGVAAHVAERAAIPVLGVPQTIDNDIAGTDVCLGFATAVQRGIEAIHGMVPSNRAHGNPMLVEVMGREAGWLALYIAIGAEADFLAIPEVPWSVDELAAIFREAGPAILAVIAEGVRTEAPEATPARLDPFGHPAREGVVHRIAAQFAERTGKYPRVQVLGYLLRGGPPSAADLHLAWRFASAVLDGLERGLSGQMAAVRDNGIDFVPLAEVRGKTRGVPVELYRDWARFLRTPRGSGSTL